VVDQLAQPGPLDAATTMGRLDSQYTWHDQKSVKAQKAYKQVKLVQLVVGASVPVVAGLSAPAAITAVLAAVVVVAEGLQQLYQWQNNWVQYRATAEALLHEKHLFQVQAGEYAGPDRVRRLAEKVENLISVQNLKWTKLHDVGSKPVSPT
jgi:hypothetical protein